MSWFRDARSHARRAPAARAHPTGVPSVVIVIAAAAVALFVLPLIGLVLRAPWSGLIDQLSSPAIRSALWLSLVCSVWATVLSALLGLPLSWVLARADVPGRRVLRGVVTLPLVLPPVVGGVALLLVLGRLGILGRWLDATFGVTLFGTPAAVIVAETFVAMPLLVLTVEGALRSMDRRYEDAAATLGGGRWLTFRRVTLPFVAPSLGAGAILSWARALGEFGATITFAGNLPGRTQTIPLAVYIELQKGTGGAVVLSLVLVAVSLVLLIGLHDRWLTTA